MTSLTFKEAVNAQETAEAFLVLITLDHADLATPIRVTSDGVNTVSNGETFYPCPFRVVFPDENGQAQLSIDNVDREIVSALRTIDSPPTVTIQVILASAPNTIEVEYDDLLLKDAEYDALVVSGRISIDHILLEPIPGDVMDPAKFPGIF